MFSRLNVRTKLLVMLLPAALGLCGLAGLGVKTRLDDRNAAQTTREASEVAATASTYVHRLQVERVAAATVAAAPSTELEATLVTERIATDEAGSRLDTVLARPVGRHPRSRRVRRGQLLRGHCVRARAQQHHRGASR